MPQTFNESKYAELVDEQSRLEGVLATLSSELNEQFESTDGSFTSEQLNQYMAKQSRHAQCGRQLEYVRAERKDMELSKPRGADDPDPDAFERFLRSGWDGLEKDEIEAHRSEMNDPAIPEGGGYTFVVKPTDSGIFIPRAATASDADSGSEAVQEKIRPGIIDRLAYYGGVEKMAQQFMTAKGNDFSIMQMDAASQEGELLPRQATDVSAQDIPDIGSVVFQAKTASSKTIGITREMIQDAVFDVVGYVDRQATRRLGRLWGKVFTITQLSGGNPIGPLGVVSLATPGMTAAATGTFTWPEITQLIYKINRAYREDGEGGSGGFSPEMGGTIGYMISDDAERILRVMVDGDNRPLWTPSTRDGAPNRLNNYPYTVNGHMDAVSTGKVPVLFGNFSYFGIRTVREVEIFRFMDSRTMQNNRVECLAFSRRDSRNMSALVNNAIEPIVKLTMK